MKSPKPLLLVLAGALITVALFSFKNEEPKKEYAFISSHESFKKDAICVTINSVYTFYSVELLSEYDKKINKIVNEMAEQGWRIVSTDYMTASTSTRYIYLERIKQ